MAKTKRNHNPNLIKARHTYSFAEIADTLKIHPRTVQSWRKQGLKVMDEAGRPYIVYGIELRRFLRAKRQKQRHPLNIGEFFCPKCKTQRKSCPDKLLVEITNKKLGKTHKQALIKGICEVCGQALLRFSSDRQVQEWNEKGLLLMEQKKTLTGNRDSSLNTYIERGEK